MHGQPGRQLILKRLQNIGWLALACTMAACGGPKVSYTSQLGEGWANNSVNTVVFRKNALTSHNGNQYAAWYDSAGVVMLAKRRLGTGNWEVQKTPHTGNVADAHNSISIMADGDGYLHVAWDHHNNALRYARSTAPGSLLLTPKMSMTGQNEKSVSYPEFYRLANGKMIFLYRDGGSGRGNLVVNSYNPGTQTWQQLHRNLVDGQGQRNAYWQACTDVAGTIHLSWVWRETPDVASNHDMCYARSRDGGLTWEKSTGEKYELPVTAATAEYAMRIPQKSELINQTAMAADEAGNPYIASYWRQPQHNVPQYQVVYLANGRWQSANAGFRTQPFSLSGMGSKRIPISRPQLLVRGSGPTAKLWIIFRDEERGSVVSVAATNNLQHNRFKVYNLPTGNVGSWEPNYDTNLWDQSKKLSLFVQRTEQADAEGMTSTPPQTVRVLDILP